MEDILDIIIKALTKFSIKHTKIGNFIFGQIQVDERILEFNFLTEEDPRSIRFNIKKRKIKKSEFPKIWSEVVGMNDGISFGFFSIARDSKELYFSISYAVDEGSFDIPHIKIMLDVGINTVISD